mmetsp:Transcript_20875/g.53042  ORF Transcript_20875/g.53042 Transcript_20875/m.53042 type:complete len:215 (-) Transcript_20875:95-739(-)
MLPCKRPTAVPTGAAMEAKRGRTRRTGALAVGWKRWTRSTSGVQRAWWPYEVRAPVGSSRCIMWGGPRGWTSGSLSRVAGFAQRREHQRRWRSLAPPSAQGTASRRLSPRRARVRSRTTGSTVRMARSKRCGKVSLHRRRWTSTRKRAWAAASASRPCKMTARAPVKPAIPTRMSVNSTSATVPSIYAAAPSTYVAAWKQWTRRTPRTRPASAS